MNYTIPIKELPAELEISKQLTPEEKDKPIDFDAQQLNKNDSEARPSIQKKSAKNSKAKTEKKSYKKTIKEKYKKPLRRGDKIQNKKKKKR